MPRPAQQHEEAPPEVEQIDPQPEEGSWEQVRGLVDAIAPGDWTRLVIFLQTYPDYQDQIISEAQAVLGNATVEQALAQLGLASQQQGTLSAQDAAAATAQFEDAPADTQGAAPTESAAETMAELDATAAQQPADPTPLDKAVMLVMTVETAEDLAALLKTHPQYREQLVEAAQQELSPEEIDRAIAMADAPTQEREEEPAPPPTGEGPAPGDAPSRPEPSSDADLQKEPAWISRARAYNFDDANIANSVEFNNVTNGAFLANGQLDPVIIANWQRDNGLEPTGRIDDATLAKAESDAKVHEEVEEEQEALPDDDLRKEAE